MGICKPWNCFALLKQGYRLISVPLHLFVLLRLKDRIFSILFSASTIDPKLLTLVLVFSVPERFTQSGRERGGQGMSSILIQCGGPEMSPSLCSSPYLAAWLSCLERSEEQTLIWGGSKDQWNYTWKVLIKHMHRREGSFVKSIWGVWCHNQ